MGMPGPLSRSSCSSYDKPEKTQVNPLNPDPSNFIIEKYQELNGFLLMLVRYPNCTNYEGNKILVYKDLTYAQVKKFKTLDPHFSNNKNYASPMARFEPTLIGWGYARRMCKS